MGDPKIATAPETPKQALYTVYSCAAEITYVPENALKEGLSMVDTIKNSLKTLKLGSKLRQDVWSREIESLQSQGAPTTLIAVCGATGAGKSSILNAILDDNIVPTNGMRACTAVVTELAYHNKQTIDADVSFLSEAEWRAELDVLLHDLVDEDGNIKRNTDLKSDAGVAWQKVHAVYPSILQEQLVTMTVDQIIARDPKIAKILGATKSIIARDSKVFAKEISKYIDSKNQKRGGKKDKKPKEKSLMDKVREAAGTNKSKEKMDGADSPALWPLIRQVNVRCSSAALSTGAILVDLPGVADANAARNNIAKDYMKKCDCIWILAPITRAVDDKTARDLLGDAFKMQLMMDGNYDDHAITFIASKCDDISCTEVIPALNLEDDPQLEEIESRIDQYNEETSEWKKRKSEAEKAAKAINTELEVVCEYQHEYEEHLQALKDNKPFTPTLTGKAAKTMVTKGKKRKNSSGGKKGSPKKHRSSPDDDEDESMESDSNSDSDSDSGSDSDFASDKGSDDEQSDDESKSGSDSEENDAGGNDQAEVTEDDLEERIKEAKEAVKSGRNRLSEARKQKKEAVGYLSTLKKHITKAQKEKNAFCSLKRSEFSRDVLKEDFRVGLKDLDDAAAEERNPDGFNPNVNLRDYDAIDLPVFTCSSRDYVRLKCQVKGDGEPSCFSNVKDTGIPDLQQWCHQLTISSRERAARNFLAHLKTFGNSVKSYVEGIGDVTAADRETLREKWESSNLRDGNDGESANGWGMTDFGGDSFDAIFGGLGGDLSAELYALNKPAPKVDPYGQPVGIAPRLALEFGKLVDKCVTDLQENFKEGLEDKCRVGATNAADVAVPTSDEFAASMHWATYRATLRRHGSWRRDLNVELIAPFTRNIAHSWSKVFESDLFAPFELAVKSCINKLLKEVEDSAAVGLKDRTKLQGELCVEEARVALQKTMSAVKETMNNQRKEVSRCMAPHVQAQLVEGYDRAMEERGTGSVARQKALFRNFVAQSKDNIFDDGADVLMERLTKVAEAVGEALDEALGALAQKVEVSLSVLWEGTRDDPTQVRARKTVVDVVADILGQILMWTQAEKSRNSNVEESDNAMVT